MIELPHYELTQVAYEGSETVLYRGRREADGAPVAVKVTRSEYPTARELARLRREFGVLQHIGPLPGVGHAYALESCGRGLALVMEDLGALSLSDLLRTRSLDIATTLKIAIALADILSSLHRLRVIHKDIKPHNIMIDEATLSPRIVDFGISALIAQETHRSAEPTLLEGTLAYMAPEQTGRMNRVVDLRADLYSLGVTLFEVLTGAVPFPATDPTEIIHSHLARAPTPPCDRSSAIPRPLSDVVMRLLAKTPEERYQSALGLKVDLEECLVQWSESAQIGAFRLGRHDLPDELRLSQKLYGREREIDALLGSFERAHAGAAELVLVSGYSGVGKSALVSEIHKPIAQKGGYFVRGKFDQLSRDVPLAPVAHAFRELLQQILTEPASALDAWKARLLAALGGNGRLLCDLLPELELLIGPQPEVPAVGPTEAKNRFGMLVQSFVRAFTTPKHTLVIFLDDLQWADPASLQMLRLLLSDPESKHLVVLGAYRDNEVDVAHPLRSLLDELAAAGAALTALTLTPLDLPQVTAFVADTLRARASAVLPLAELVFDKTQGNPFFLGQLLGALHDERLLWVDPAERAFTWDIERIRRVKVTDNVVDLMVGKLVRLPPATKRVLLLAACVGYAFDLDALATTDQRAPSAVAADLWEAMREGLIVPLDGDYRFLDASAGAAGGADTAAFRVAYRFLHDRVREAAYSLIGDDQKEAIHLSIGRLLWARSGQDPRDEDLLEIVRHLNLGGRGIEREEEREALSRLNLRAGRKAKAATAYQAAAASFCAGRRLLGDAGWESAYETCFALHAEGAECAYLSGAGEEAEALFHVLLPRAKSDLERARIHDLRVVLYISQGKFTDAIKAGLEGLALLGVTLPETPAEQEADFGAGLAEAENNLDGRRIEDLIHAPRMDDPARLVELQLLCDICIPVFAVMPSLYGSLVIRQVNASLTYGHSDVSAFAYMIYGFMLAALMNQPSPGYAFGCLAIALNDKLENTAQRCKLDFVFSGYMYLREPVRGLLPLLQQAREGALSSGDFVYLSFIWYSGTAVKFGLGDQLEEVREEVERGLAVTQRMKNETAIGVLRIIRQAIANLQGKTLGRATLSSDGFDEDAFRAKLTDKDQTTVASYFYLFKLHLLYLHGDYPGAVAAAQEAQRTVASIGGLYYATRLDLYAILAHFALPPAAAPEEAARRAEAIAGHRARIAWLAATCPRNFQHHLLLIEAEEARLSGKADRAVDLYDRAIALSHESALPHDEALGNELCAKLYLSIGRAKLARPYMTDAHLGYLHWGATAKAEDLAREYGYLLPSQRPSDRRRSLSLSSSTTTSGTTILHGTSMSGLREAALVVRATQAVAGELALPKVIERLSQLVLENAGAQRGALLLSRDGRLFVEATFGIDPQGIAVGPSAPLDTRPDLAQSVPLFVARTREAVVLDDARADVRFNADPYFATAGARSVLCLPLIHQGRLIGLLYLEHRDATAAFNEARVELLELLSSQAAVAIENALLIAHVRAANEEVQRANERLEADVVDRTEELRLANRQLGVANQRLHVELEQREQAERERAALQEQMLEAQRQRLAELSTPLIPLTDRIVVMPLIGTVDAERAAQVLEAALTGAQRHRARVVILDITGMKHVDTQVTGTLLRTASALRLLGAQAVLTGIRPEIAQAMVSLGVHLDTIVTRGTLQSGIAYALKRVNEAGRS